MRHILAVLSSMSLWLLPAAALAHAHLTGASPEEGAELTESPETIELRYSEGIEARFSTFSLHSLGSDGAADPAGAPAVSLGEPAAMNDTGVALAVEETLEPGDYALVWEVLAQDGHTTSGVLNFSIAD